MTLREFIELVESMRAAQVAYFQVRDKGDLVAAKQLERSVDATIHSLTKSPEYAVRWANTQLLPKQKTLF